MNPAELLVIVSKKTDEHLNSNFQNNKFPRGGCIILFTDGHPCRLEHIWLLLERGKWEDNTLMFEILHFPDYADLRIIALALFFFSLCLKTHKDFKCLWTLFKIKNIHSPSLLLCNFYSSEVAGFKRDTAARAEQESGWSVVLLLSQRY